MQGYNGSDKIGYAGPCPPAGSGTHRYIFELYALDKMLDLRRDTTRQDLEKAMKDHVLDKVTLTGLFSAD
jgi:Raf kinase inhibitor-like YbhB/YbcL family protein